MVDQQKDKTIRAADLIRQIDNYGYPRGSQSCLSDKGIKELNHDISQYQAHHKRKIASYKEANGISEDKRLFAAQKPHYFRQQLIEYIAQLAPPHFSGDENERKTHPELATLKMEELLGPKGRMLYLLALEEEMHSREYRHAVVMRATTHYDGAKWKERPVVIVAGPSGCGKSFAAQSAVKTANRFLAADEHNMDGNNVIAADGGICREVSQMRKLVIQVANNQGYAGIKDLHAQSKVLEEVKSRVQAAAFASPEVGVVIPETFSKWIDPTDPIKNFMKKIDKLSNTKLIFARVKGEQEEDVFNLIKQVLPGFNLMQQMLSRLADNAPSTFQRIVAFMGSRRAWKVEGFTPTPLDLNTKELTESKAYNWKGFLFGVVGSYLAEQWFREHSKDKLSMIITNDLILLKRDPHSTTETWLPAEENDKGARLFSRHAYEAWLQLPDDGVKQDLIHHCRTNAQSIITTAAQIDFAIAQKQISSRLVGLNKKLEQEFARGERDQNKIHYLMNKRDTLLDINKISPKDLENLDSIEKIHNQVKLAIAIIKEEKQGSWKRISFSKTLNALNEINAGLDKARSEFKDIKTEVQQEERSAVCSTYKAAFKLALNKEEQKTEKSNSEGKIPLL
ncbi:hypothetical protein [Legionella drancourtii]|uniref:Uncharacterized protein n=1 Tax=Legionella drancourtii LLAP12 TaxID=658187 RepID=G9ET33_9GAMM|nr:hypothetical protein [Legionella drancourtii]EHL29500.1 hypothetical protein LDG_8462 [Legionella drancourtii LLAP12]